MTKEVHLGGVTYSNVPSINLPDSNGDYHSFIDAEDVGPTTSDKPVKFIDYDGTLVASYTLAETAALSALPACPTHTGLTSQGWNYTLAQLKTQATAMGGCIVGHNLITNNGDTRIYIELDTNSLSPTIGLCVKGTLTIDWGDETTPGTLTGTSLTTRKDLSHTYASTGEYTITITPSSGTTFQAPTTGSSGTGTYILFDSSKGSTISSSNSGKIYSQSIKHIELGSGISTLSNYIFQTCVSLESISIPSTVTSIGTSAFAFCYSLKSISIPSEVTSINIYTFQNCYSLKSVSIPSEVTSIGNYDFSYCFALELISLPSKVTSIATYAFQNCCSLKSLSIPSGVTSIGTYAFRSCYLFESISLPSEITSIGTYTFQNCYALKSISIPSKVTSIGNYAFSNCYALESVSLSSKVTSIGTYAFQNCYVLKSISLPSGVTSIGTNAFSSCYALESISLPSGVTSIGNYTFQNCYSLKSISLSSEVTSIGNSAFSSCFSLESISIPSKVTSIGTSAFSSNSSLLNYYINPTNPPTLSNTNTFTTIQSGTKIHVPAASLSSYQTASYWSTYASYMVGDL